MDSSIIVNDIRPLKGPVDIKEGIAFWPLIALFLLLVLGILIFLYFKRRKDTSQINTTPSKSPYEIAIEELNVLLDMKLIEKGLVKEYYIRLSDIMRKFVEARFKIFALDRTTWELYREMRLKKIERKRVDRIRDFLEDCDLVKFAKYIPSRKEIETSHSKAKDIIDICAESKSNLDPAGQPVELKPVQPTQLDR